ncbi:MAG: SET domain-containing protein-lysine N-methyltransferase [Chryseolinea sp.]
MSYNSKTAPIAFVIVSAEIAEIRIDAKQNHRSLYSRKSFTETDIIAEFSAKEVFSTPTYLTVQVSDTEHIELLPEYLECINHSCTPNCFFNTSTGKLIALRSIEEGEELTFFYPSTEWDMDQAFKCGCGTKACIGMIKGAKHLTPELVKNYRFTDFISKKLASRG